MSDRVPSSDCSSDSEAEEVIGALSHKKLGRYWKYVSKAGGTNLKAAYQLTNSDLETAGVESPSQREKILLALEAHRKRNRRAVSHIGNRKPPCDNKMDKKGKSMRSASRSIRFSRFLLPRYSGGSSSDERDEKEEIRNLLSGLGILNLDTTAFAEKFPTIKICKGLSHSDLLDFGIKIVSRREKILEAFEKFKAGSPSSNDNGDSEYRGNRSGNSSSESFMVSRRGDGKKRRSLPRKKKLDGRNHSDATMSSNRKMRSEKTRRSEVTEIMRIIEDTCLKRKLNIAAFLERFNTIQKCKTLTHSDLKALGVQKYSQRELIIAAFRNCDDYPDRSTDENSSSPSIDEYSDEEGEKKQIMRIIKKAGVEKDFDTSRLLENFNTLEKCKTLSHAELMEFGLKDFHKRLKLLTVFRQVHSSSGSGAARRSSGVDHSHSSSGVGHSSSGVDPSEREKIIKMIEGTGLTVDTVAILQKFDTLQRCRELNHSDLRGVIEVDTTVNRDKIIAVFREYRNPSEETFFERFKVTFSTFISRLK